MAIEIVPKQADSPKDVLVQSSIESHDRPLLDGSFSFLRYAVNSNVLIPPWWSRKRDVKLRRFAKSGDHISSAVYTFQSKIESIPFHVEPHDMTINAHIALADQWNVRLHEWAQYGDGWGNFIIPWLEDLLCQDNGAFFEILDGSKNKRGPITGEVLSIGHLDANRCRRTGNWEYPIIYEADDGLHELHWTRVGISSQMKSADIDMNGVGYCAISRAFYNAQRLIDMDTYNQEKLGSRPPRGMLLVGGGLSPEQVGIAFDLSRQAMNNENLTRFSKVPVVGDVGIENPSIELINLANLPDGFDQEKATTLAIASIALAFGMDARELFPMIGSGATRADALLQHIKQRGKGTGEVLTEIETILNRMVLPRTLKVVFDYQDDAQDRQRADINEVRSRARTNNITNKSLTVRVAREQMLSDGEINDEQFAQLELEDGRLPDGRDAMVMFFTNEPFISEIINIPESFFIPTPETNPTEVLNLIEEKRLIAMRMLAQNKAQNRIRLIRNALAALRAVELRWKPENPMDNPASEQTFSEQLRGGDEMTPDSEANNVSEDLRNQQDEREVINA